MILISNSTFTQTGTCRKIPFPYASNFYIVLLVDVSRFLWLCLQNHECITVYFSEKQNNPKGIWRDENRGKNPHNFQEYKKL